MDKFLPDIIEKNYLSNILKNLPSCIVFRDLSAFQFLSSFLLKVLDNISNQKNDSSNNFLILAIAKASRNILYGELNTLNITFLQDIINKHLIWKDMKRWIYIALELIKNRVEKQQKRKLILEQSYKERNIGKVNSKPNQKKLNEQKDLIFNRVCAFETLWALSGLMYIFQIPEKNVFQYIHKIAIDYSITEDKMSDILIEYKSNFPIMNLLKKQTNHKYTSYHLGSVYQLKNIESLLKNCIPFLRSKKELKNYLLISKKIYENLKRFIFKRILQTDYKTISLNNRRDIWVQLVGLSSFKNDKQKNEEYENITNVIKNNHDLIKRSRETIMQDVSRSYLNVEKIKSNVKFISHY